MTIEASIKNKLDNNRPFVGKLTEYKKSAYKLCNEYCVYEKFDPSIIALRQEKMAEIAKTIWKSAFVQSMV